MTVRARRQRPDGTLGPLTEAGFQAQVVGLARALGWRRIFHAPAGGHGTGQSRRVDREQLPEGKGFPDLILLRGGRLVVAELKTEKGRLGPGQQDWLDAWNELAKAVAWARVNALTGSPRDRRDQLERSMPSVAAYLWRPSDLDDIQRVLT